MNKLFSLVLLIGGIVLIVYGVNASESFGSSLSRFFTGSPTDKTIWFFVGGVIATVWGASGLLRGTTSR